MKTINSSLQIRTKAVKLLEEHCLSNLREISIPYLISHLKQNITCQFADLKGLAGFTCHDHARDRYRMFLDSTTEENCPSRTSFTMAHELGHIVLDHFGRAVTSSIFIDDRFLEIEANLFADELLMPTEPITQYRMDAREVAATYNVSITAANNKIKYLENNAIYRQEKDNESILKIMNRYITLFRYDRDDAVVSSLRNAWLDPDY